MGASFAFFFSFFCKRSEFAILDRKPLKFLKKKDFHSYCNSNQHTRAAIYGERGILDERLLRSYGATKAVVRVQTF